MVAYVVFYVMHCLRGGTSSLISVEKIWPASAAFSMVIWCNILPSGFIVVSSQLLLVHLVQSLVSLDG
jgi:hypothetical protein